MRMIVIAGLLKRPLSRIRISTLLPIAACLLIAGCSAPREDRSASSGAAEKAVRAPLTASEEGGIREQIERNWNLGSLAGSSHLSGTMVELRAKLLPDGTVTEVAVMNDEPGNPDFAQVADSARRAVMISSPLKLPPGKTYPIIVLRFYPDRMIE